MEASRSLRDEGARIGELEPGPANSIADVAGVRVGHVTVWRDEPEPPAGRGVARTGVTAIVPADPATLRTSPLRAGVTAAVAGCTARSARSSSPKWRCRSCSWPAPAC